MKKTNKHVGSNFDSFLKEEGILEESQAAAVKKVLAYQIMEAMKEKKISKLKMAEKMHTKSRAQLDRLLDPDNKSVTLLTLEKAANALNKRLECQLV
jgi:hypothetical protein